jgi:hypothetical protein
MTPASDFRVAGEDLALARAIYGLKQIAQDGFELVSALSISSPPCSGPSG